MVLHLSLGLMEPFKSVSKSGNYTDTASGELDGEVYRTYFAKDGRLLMPMLLLDGFLGKETFRGALVQGGFLQLNGMTNGQFYSANARLGYRAIAHTSQLSDIEFSFGVFVDKPIIDGNGNFPSTVGGGVEAGILCYLSQSTALWIRSEHGWLDGSYAGAMGAGLQYAFGKGNTDLSSEIAERADYKFDSLSEDVERIGKLCTGEKFSNEELKMAFDWLADDGRLDPLGLYGIGHYFSRVGYLANDAWNRSDADYRNRVAQLENRGYRTISSLFTRVLEQLKKSNTPETLTVAKKAYLYLTSQPYFSDSEKASWLVKIQKIDPSFRVKTKTKGTA